MVHSKNIDSLGKVLARYQQLSCNGHLTRSATHGTQPCSLKINSSASPKSMPAKLVNSVNEEKEEEEEKKTLSGWDPRRSALIIGILSGLDRLHQSNLNEN